MVSKKFHILVLLVILLTACQATPVPTMTLDPKQVEKALADMQTKTAVAAQASVTTSKTFTGTPLPTDEPTAEPTAEPTEVEPLVVEYQLPENFVPLPDIDQMYGVFYVLNEKGPVEVPYPFQSTVIISLGKGKVGQQTFATDGDGTIGNIYADVCAEVFGCKVEVDKYKAGHVGVSIITGGFEVPGQTVADAVNRMLNGETNCGNKCLTINVGYENGDKKSFSAPIEATDIALNDPQAPFAEVVWKFPGVPSGAEVVLDEENTPIGHQYYLAGSPSKVSIPETGGTVINCGVKCSIDGKEYNAGAVLVFIGKTDGTTPKDLNRTAVVESSEPNMIRVIMIYDDFQAQVENLKILHPDWEWSAKN